MSSTGRHRAGPGLLVASLSELADLALARSCAGCGLDGTRWCPACAQCLGGPLLLRPLGKGTPAVWSAAPYEGVVQTAVVAWKDRDRPDLSPYLALALQRAARAAVGAGALAGCTVADGAVADGAVADGAVAHGAVAGRSLVIVPAPSSPAARRARGWHPVRDLARRTASGLRRRGIDARAQPLLRQRRRVLDQARLDASDRADNLAGALEVPPGWHRYLRGRPCLLVDDVVTSGATLREAARALRAAGAGCVVAATVAATPLRSDAAALTMRF